MHKKSIPLYLKVKKDQIVGSTINGIVILQEGKDKVGDNFDIVALNQLAELGNAQPQGVKCRFGHPNMCDSALGTYIGRYKNFRVELADETAMSDPAGQISVVKADLTLSDIAKKAPKWGDLHSYILGMAEKENDMFGNSIVYQPGEPETMEQEDGSFINYERFLSFPASDLVDSPAATTSLFKDVKDFSFQATRFLDENPELFDALVQNPEVVKEFVIKYNNYKKTKPMTKPTTTVKSFAERMKDAKKYLTELFKEEGKDIQSATADGKTVNISDSDGDGIPMAGDTVTDETGAVMANATIAMQDGSTITTDDAGAITAITPKQEAAPPGNEMQACKTCGTMNKVGATVCTSCGADPNAAPKEDKELAAEWKAKYEKEVADREASEAAADETIKQYQDQLSKIKSTWVPPVSETQQRVHKEGTEKEMTAEERKAGIERNLGIQKIMKEQRKNRKDAEKLYDDALAAAKK